MEKVAEKSTPRVSLEDDKEHIDLDVVENSISTTHPENHKQSGQYIKSIVYGGLDGIVSIFVTVAASSGTNSALGMVLVLGLAKLIAGAISMGVGDWLSTDAEVDMAKVERKREEWEVDNYIEGEIQEMVEFYMGKGVPEENARELVSILAKYKGAFVDIMMAEELGISPDTVNEKPWKHGLVNFTSFTIFGIVPLIVYVFVVGLSHVEHVDPKVAFYISIATTGVTLFGMGAVKGRLTGSNSITGGMITLLFGAMTAFVSWFIGFILDRSFPGVNVAF